MLRVGVTVVAALVVAGGAYAAIVPQQGIGGARLGMSQKAVKAALGAPSAVRRGSNEIGSYVTFTLSVAAGHLLRRPERDVDRHPHREATNGRRGRRGLDGGRSHGLASRGEVRDRERLPPLLRRHLATGQEDVGLLDRAWSCDPRHGRPRDRLTPLGAPGRVGRLWRRTWCGRRLKLAPSFSPATILQPSLKVSTPRADGGTSNTQAVPAAEEAAR